MSWTTESKKVRGTAMDASKHFAKPMLPMGTALVNETGRQVYVRFDKGVYDPRAGAEYHGKLYDTPEEAIQELGARTVERVLKDGESVEGVHVSLMINKWTED